MTDIEKQLEENREEYRALMNLRHVISIPTLFDWLCKYDVKWLPLAHDPDLLSDLVGITKQFVEKSVPVIEEILQGKTAIGIAVDEVRSQGNDLQIVKDLFK
jgi:hypothetical protein